MTFHIITAYIHTHKPLHTIPNNHFTIRHSSLWFRSAAVTIVAYIVVVVVVVVFVAAIHWHSRFSIL